MLLTPYEIVEFGIHPIRVDHGNYAPIQPQQYELPCMPDEIESLTGKITEQRIDPQILNPVYNPFGDELKPSTSKHIKSNYSRSSIAHQRGDTMVYHHDHNKTQSQSLSMSVSSLTANGGVGYPSITSPNAWTSKQILSTNDSALRLFSRTNKSQAYVGGLPRPMNDDEDSMEFDVISVPSPSMGSISQPPMNSTKSAFSCFVLVLF